MPCRSAWSMTPVMFWMWWPYSWAMTYCSASGPSSAPSWLELVEERDVEVDRRVGRAVERAGASSSRRRSRWPTALGERHGVGLAELAAGGGDVAAQNVSSESSVALKRHVRSVFACSAVHSPTVPLGCGAGSCRAAGDAGQVHAGEQVDRERRGARRAPPPAATLPPPPLADAATAEAATLLERHPGNRSRAAGSARASCQFSPRPRAASASPVARACPTIRTAAGTSMRPGLAVEPPGAGGVARLERHPRQDGDGAQEQADRRARTSRADRPTCRSGRASRARASSRVSARVVAVTTAPSSTSATRSTRRPRRPSAQPRAHHW